MTSGGKCGTGEMNGKWVGRGRGGESEGGGDKQRCHLVSVDKLNCVHNAPCTAVCAGQAEASTLAIVHRHS